MPWDYVNYGHVVYSPCPWATKVGTKSSHRTKGLLNPPVLVLKTRHLSGSAFCTASIGVPDFALGWLPLGWDLFWKISLLNFHASVIKTVCSLTVLLIQKRWSVPLFSLVSNVTECVVIGYSLWDGGYSFVLCGQRLKLSLRYTCGES